MLLLNYGAKIELTSSDITPLQCAVEGRHVPIIRLLIERGAWVDSKFLSWASREGYAIIIEVLLDKDWDVDGRRGYWERTPLFNAAGYGHEQAVRRLLDRGADIEAKDSEGKTPIFLAAEYGHKHIVNLLVERGTNINVQDEFGETPSTWAACCGQTTMAQLLQPKA